MTQNSVFSRTAIMFAGGLVTLGLFVFMSQLVKNDQIFSGTATEAPVLQILQEIPKPIPPKHVEKMQPQPPIQRPLPTAIPIASGKGIAINSEFTPPVMPATTESYAREPGSGEAMPVIQISPQYPIAAARDGKEGYVVVEFDISTLGTVINAKVIEAEPKRVFDKSAIQAIKGWKYKPKIEQGNPVMLEKQRVRLDFSLEQQ